LPKAELHVHIEGTLEPEMMFEMASRNGVDLPFASVEETRAAYDFDDLQSFLDLYYQGAAVLRTSDDFYELTLAYLDKAAADGVRRAEIFFDPQIHLARGVEFDVMVDGMWRAGAKAGRLWNISSGFIMCIVRNLPSEEAEAMVRGALPHAGRLLGIGMDSSEVGYPPEPFAAAYRLARDAGLHTVAHAGEEGPPEYIWGALEALGAERIEHEATAEQDDKLMQHLRDEGIPITACPISSLRLGVYDTMEDTFLRRFHERGLRVTINSDDPAYFGGYILDNYLALAEVDVPTVDLLAMARTSLEVSFLGEADKADVLAEFDAYVTANF